MELDGWDSFFHPWIAAALPLRVAQPRGNWQDGIRGIPPVSWDIQIFMGTDGLLQIGFDGMNKHQSPARTRDMGLYHGDEEWGSDGIWYGTCKPAKNDSYDSWVWKWGICHRFVKHLKGILMILIHGALGYPIFRLPSDKSISWFDLMFRFGFRFVCETKLMRKFVWRVFPLVFWCFWCAAKQIIASGHELFHLLHEEMKKAGWGPNEAQSVKSKVCLWGSKLSFR